MGGRAGDGRENGEEGRRGELWGGDGAGSAPKLKLSPTIFLAPALIRICHFHTK